MYNPNCSLQLFKDKNSLLVYDEKEKSFLENAFVCLVTRCCTEISRIFPIGSKLIIYMFYVRELSESFGEDKIKIKKRSDVLLVSSVQFCLNQRELIVARRKTDIRIIGYKTLFKRFYYLHKHCIFFSSLITVFNKNN